MGALTFLASSVGLVQNDLKRVIAYSTCSQLGYMVFAAGLSHYSIALFHLANHALFKALLFLSAGCIIHGLSDEQDMRKMGGVINYSSELHNDLNRFFGPHRFPFNRFLFERRHFKLL